MSSRFRKSGSSVFLLLSFLLLHSCLTFAQQSNPHRRWLFFEEQTQNQSPAVGSDGTIYIGTGMPDTSLPSSGIYAVYHDGTQKWKLTLGKTIHSSIAAEFASERSLECLCGEVKSLARITTASIRTLKERGVGKEAN